MSYIYRPKGRAREYSPLALNIYGGGCDHACKYCYCSGVLHGQWGTEAKQRNMCLSALRREARKASEQILLSFIADPYCSAELMYGNTKDALTVLRDEGCSVAILTKGGKRCLRDLGLFSSWPDGRIKTGATLTFLSESKSLQYEPGAAVPDDRLQALKDLHEAGVKTWVSIEPVIDPSESLAVIKASLPFTDSYKIGRWNHDSRSESTDWAAFACAAVSLMRDSGKRFYIKDGLRSFLPEGFLTAEESCPDSLCLPCRPEGWRKI